MKRMENNTYMDIEVPADFNFNECLVYLGRSEQEILHEIRDGFLYKLIKINGDMLLLRIGTINQLLRVEFLSGNPSANARKKIADYIAELFDINRNIVQFYEQARKDRVLKPIVEKYKGLRIIGIPDLFEALTWAIIGQQINLSFAYTLKKRFVEQFGGKLIWQGNAYWLYPDYETIAEIRPEDLAELQFSKRKAEYIIDVAKAMTNGELSKDGLCDGKDVQQIRNTLLAIRGVGEWTADYVLMKCMHEPSAFPIADVGLHNALKEQLGLERKPTIEEIKAIAKNWTGWEAYATFYLWRSLYE